MLELNASEVEIRFAYYMSMTMKIAPESLPFQNDGLWLVLPNIFTTSALTAWGMQIDLIATEHDSRCLDWNFPIINIRCVEVEDRINAHKTTL